MLFWMSQPAPSARFTHPLAGVEPGTLATVLKRSGMVSRSAIPTLLLAGISALARSPLSLWERRHADNLLAELNVPAPIFIVGHWRSGTTHLYNTLSASGAFSYVRPLEAGLPANMLTLNRWFRRSLENALPSSRLIDRVPVKPDSPQEDEVGMANLSSLSFFHGIYFPRAFHEHFRRGVFLEGVSEAQIASWEKEFLRYLLKLHLSQSARPLLIKNPVYTARIAQLRRLWPEARFIHIHRNPYAIFPSMRNFYRKLFPALALQPYDNLDMDTHIFETYARMMQALERDRADVPDGHWVEFSYDELTEQPMETLAGIYEKLSLPDFEQHRPQMERYLGSIEQYRKNRFELDEASRKRISEQWAPWIEAYGYSLPQTS